MSTSSNNFPLLKCETTERGFKNYVSPRHAVERGGTPRPSRRNNFLKRRHCPQCQVGAPRQSSDETETRFLVPRHPLAVDDSPRDYYQILSCGSDKSLASRHTFKYHDPPRHLSDVTRCGILKKPATRNMLSDYKEVYGNNLTLTPRRIVSFEDTPRQLLGVYEAPNAGLIKRHMVDIVDIVGMSLGDCEIENCRDRSKSVSPRPRRTFNLGKTPRHNCTFMPNRRSNQNAEESRLQYKSGEDYHAATFESNYRKYFEMDF